MPYGRGAVAGVPRAIGKELEEIIPGFWLDFLVTHTQIYIHRITVTELR